MTHEVRDSRAKMPLRTTLGDLAGCRYWSASLIPALVGTTLPLWLRPPGFSFRSPAAIEFLVAVLLVHAGLAFLLAWIEKRVPVGWPSTRLLGLASSCLAVGVVLGVHLNSGLTLNQGVPDSIFLVYGACTLFAGALYVMPPFSLRSHLGGEVVLWGGLGLLPVLGAYLVQVGDLSRTVYLASAPLVVSLALWVWVDELKSIARDEEHGRQTMVLLVGSEYSRRIGVPVLLFLLYATVVLAVLTSAVPFLALAILFSIGPAWKIGVSARSQSLSFDESNALLTKTTWLYLATGLIVAASPVLTLFV